MTVAAASEVGPVGTPAVTLGKASGRVPGAESFRSGWQALLASLGSGVNASSPAVHAGGKESLASNGSPTEKLAAAIPSTPTLVAKEVLQPRLRISEESLSEVQRSSSLGPGLGSAPVAKGTVSGTAPLNTQQASQERPAAPRKEQSSKPQAPDAQNRAEGAAASTAPQADTSAAAQPEAAVPAVASTAPVVVPVTTNSVLTVLHEVSKQPASDPAASTPEFDVASAKATPLISTAGAGLAAAEPAGKSESAQSLKSAVPAPQRKEPAPPRDELMLGGANSKDVDGPPTQAAPSASVTSSHRGARTIPAAQESTPVRAAGSEFAQPVLIASGASHPSQEVTAVAAQDASVQSNAARATAPVATRPVHGGAGGTAAQVANRLGEGQLQPRASENAQVALASDLVSAPAASGTLRSESNPAVSATAARNAFSELDGQSASSPATWTHAGARGAEAGFQDPALGWVCVRADVTAGGIHASLVPASTDAAQALGGHLAGLSTHLAEQHMPLETLTMAAPERSGIDAGVGSDPNRNMHQEADQGSQSAQEAEMGNDDAAAASNSAQELQPLSSGFEATAWPAMAGGAHISVMA